MWKAAAGALGAGTAVAGGALAYKGLTKPTTHSIRDLLATKNPEKRLISKSADGSSTEWKAAGKLYLTSYKKDGKNPFSLNRDKPNTEPDGNENAPSEFMSKCESLSKEMVVDKEDSRYQNVLIYCTRNTLVKDLIIESGRTLLQESGDDWGASWKSYREVNTGKGEKQDVGQLSDGKDKQNVDSPVSDDLKNKCKEKLESNAGVQVNDDYPNVVKGCSK